ncbi:myeloid-associated differentiation marker-like [Callithrix jacchus]
MQVIVTHPTVTTTVGSPTVLESPRALTQPLGFHRLLSVTLYATALVLWPLYQFSEKYAAQLWRAVDVSCSDRNPYHVCSWDRRLAVTILTAVNLLAYVGDLVYSAHLVFVNV